MPAIIQIILSRLKLARQEIHITSFLPISIALSFILSTGPNLNLFVLSPIKKETSSIYGSVYGEAHALFPNLEQWILNGLGWQFLCLATVIYFFALKRKKPQQVFWSTAVITFSLIFIYDLFAQLIYGSLSIAIIFEISIACMVGAFLIGIMSLALLMIRELCVYNETFSKIIGSFIASLVVISSGVFTSTFIYIITAFFYNPIPVKIDTIFAYPIVGGYAPKETSNGKNGVKPFKLIDVALDDGSTTTISRYGTLKANWRSKEPSLVFDATISLFEGCYAPYKFPKAKHSILLNDIKQLDIWFDEGPADFNTINTQNNEGRMYLDQLKPALFSIERETTSKSLNFIQSIDKNSRLTISNTNDHSAFYMTAPIVDTKGKTIIESNRTLIIRTDKQVIKAKVSLPQNLSPTKKVKCSAISTKKAFSKEKFTLENGINVGAHVRIKANAIKKNLINLDPLSETIISGTAGLISFKGLNENSFMHGSQGYIKFIRFKGNIQLLKVDGIQSNINVFDRYYAFGDFNGSYETNAQLRIVGQAKILSKENRRMNPTKWEKLEWEARTILISIFSALVIFLCSPIISRLKSNAPFQHH